jgi:hypothetical protein
MRLRRINLRLRTGLILVAVSAVPLSYADWARRRWAYCWMRQAQYAAEEARCVGEAAAAVGRPPIRNYSDAVGWREIAESFRHKKWKWRLETLRFWEPPELAEAKTEGS